MVGKQLIIKPENINIFSLKSTLGQAYFQITDYHKIGDTIHPTKDYFLLSDGVTNNIQVSLSKCVSFIILNYSTSYYLSPEKINLKDYFLSLCSNTDGYGLILTTSFEDNSVRFEFNHYINCEHGVLFVQLIDTIRIFSTNIKIINEQKIVDVLLDA